jgi:hypothetical protein
MKECTIRDCHVPDINPNIGESQITRVDHPFGSVIIREYTVTIAMRFYNNVTIQLHFYKYI